MLLDRPACVQVSADPTQQGLAPRVPGFPEAFPDSRFSTLCRQCLENRTSPRGSTNSGPGPVSKGLQAVGDWTHTAVIHTTVEGVENRGIRGRKCQEACTMGVFGRETLARQTGLSVERHCSRDPSVESREHPAQVYLCRCYCETLNPRATLRQTGSMPPLF